MLNEAAFLVSSTLDMHVEWYGDRCRSAYRVPYPFSTGDPVRLLVRYGDPLPMSGLRVEMRINIVS